MGVRIKICGITRASDAADAAAAGADAIGTVIVERSRRYVSPFHARTIFAAVPPFVTRVGLFANWTLESMLGAIEESGCDTVQLHGDERPELAAALRPRVKVVKAIRVRGIESLEAAQLFAGAVDGLLLDAYVDGTLGGSGAQFDWSLAEAARRFPGPIIVAGGLRPETVAEAIRRFRPHGVDVSSGVEWSPGIKDSARMAAFVAAARAAGAEAA